MIQFKNLSCGYGLATIVKDVTLKIEQNKITTIIGKNGSGKSTLIKSIVGLRNVTGGKIFLNNKDTSLLKTKEVARQVSYLSQQHQTPSISVGKLVLHGRFSYICYPRSYSKEDIRRSEVAMEQAGVLEYRQKNVSSLSGGERQKVYLAMCLAGDADVFLFDEPTTYLDISYQLELLNTMKSLKQAGKTVVTVLHDLNSAMQISDTIVVMNGGKVVAKGTPNEIFQSKVINETFNINVKKLMDEDGKFHYFFEAN